MGGIDDELVANQSGIEIAEGRRSALQVGLDGIVGGMTEAITSVERQVVEDAPEEWIALSGPVDPHVDVVEQHRGTRVDVDDHTPVAVALLGHGRFHLGLVEAEWAQRGVNLAVDAIVQPLDGVGVEIHTAAAKALETQESEHVGTHLLADPTHLHSDTGGVRERPGEQAQQEPSGPPDRSTSPRQGIALRHLTV